MIRKAIKGILQKLLQTPLLCSEEERKTKGKFKFSAQPTNTQEGANTAPDDEDDLLF